MFETYADLVNYFETSIPAKVPDIKGVTVGSDEALMATQNSRSKYPHLWVETPDVSFRGSDDNPSKRFRFAMAVITNEPKKTPAEANRQLSDMLAIAERLWARLVHDADEGLFDLALEDSQGQPIRQWSGDNCYGWRLTPVQIDLERCECEGC